jgi:glycosyltransferase involved in cell wall biosynthesis
MPEIVLVHAPEGHLPGGGAEVRARALTTELARKFDVRLVTVGAGGDVAAEPTLVGRGRAALRGIPPRYTQGFDRRAAAELGAVLGAAKVVVAETLFALPYLLRAECPVVLDAHNVESHVVRRLARRHPSHARRLAYAATSSWSRRWERAAAGKVAQVWAVSEAEAEWFRQVARDVVVVPNGVSVPPEPPPEVLTASVVFVGALNAQFNRDGLTWFLRECWPTIRSREPRATLHVAGQGSADFAADGVIAHGFVDDLEHVYRLARIAIVPLLDGAGTRLKALEAMAYGRPVVSTSIGVDGIELVPGRDALVADDARGFADACLTLLTDDAEARRLAGHGRRLVTTRYDWKHIGESAVAAISRLL